MLMRPKPRMISAPHSFEGLPRVVVRPQRFVVDLAIAPDELRRLYAGAANTVVARDRLTGRSVRFPANRLREFVTHAGVVGRFELVVGPDQRLLELRRQ